MYKLSRKLVGQLHRMAGAAMPRAAALVALVCLGLLVAREAHGQRGDAPAPPGGEPDAYDLARVGESDPRQIIVPTNQVLSPLGRQVGFSSRPHDLVLSPDRRHLAVLSHRHVLIIDTNTGDVVSTTVFPGSYAGILFTADGTRVLASGTGGALGVFHVSPQGKLTALAPIDFGKKSLPVGLALAADGNTLWVALNLKNTLAQVDLETGRILREIEVGNAPYGVALVGSKAFVSNWAGRQVQKGAASGPGGKGAPVRVDPRRYIANDGSVSVVDLAAGKELKQIPVGLHPSAIVAAADGRTVYVANANSDSVSVIDTARSEVTETVSVRPAEQLLFGSSPNGLALDPGGKRLYVSNGTNNAVALIDLAPPHSRLVACLPTAWYPAGLALDAPRGRLYVANVKGTGSRNTDWKGKRKVKGQVVYGYNSHDHSGSVSLIDLPKPAELPELTKTVLANNRLTMAVSALAPPRPGRKPVPLPQRHGEPSTCKHVLYIIKENRTYDQVFGDIERGEGDPELCIFGREVTPNHHKLAEEFVQLDNFYCSGVLSADGHHWANEAFVTDYLEKAFAGFPRSYPYDGGDAMAYGNGGFLWDNALSRHKTLRIYGEFVSAKIRWKDPARTAEPSFLDCYRDFTSRTGLIEIRATPNIASLTPHVCADFIGFPGTVPDVQRADVFIRELREFEREGKLPELMIMQLPNDHTAGTQAGMPTPAAAVADNDLALGRIVEAVSQSRFWPETCIFVVEDDPQNGFDHIDGHRTVALVISPYARRGTLVSTNYNQTGMVRSIELMLGLGPMNQFDASATAMADCFTEELDNTPYTAVPNKIPLDQLNPQISAIRDPRQRHWAEISATLPLDEVDAADEDTLNRILWHAQRGRDDTYPAWAVLADADDDVD